MVYLNSQKGTKECTETKKKVDSVSKTQKKDSNGNFSSICLALLVTLASNNTQKRRVKSMTGQLFSCLKLCGLGFERKSKFYLLFNVALGVIFVGNFSLLCKLEAICARKE